jgi:hypothetical protein
VKIGHFVFSKKDYDVFKQNKFLTTLFVLYMATEIIVFSDKKIIMIKLLSFLRAVAIGVIVAAVGCTVLAILRWLL